MHETPALRSTGVSGSSDDLLAAVALQVVHRVYRNRVAADEVVVVVHVDLLMYRKICPHDAGLGSGAVLGSHYITGMTGMSFHYI